MVHARIQPQFESWRATARRLRMQSVSPENVFWTDASSETNLLPDLCESSAAIAITAAPRVPPEFMPLARTLSLHRDPGRWALMYRLLWRLTHDEPGLLHITVDDDVNLALKMQKAISRDIHKMHAFVRFRKVVDEEGEHMIAWHRPDHFIVPSAGPWFARRFAAMRWTILTPDKSVAWDLHELEYGPGVPASAAPQADAVEDLWKAYYASIFNPARVKVKAMKKEMPVRHWATLPEADLIDDLLKAATPRVETMMAKSRSAGEKTTTVSAAPFVPPDRSLVVLQKAAAICKGCDLYCHATQTVFGEGPETAGVMFVGEQPGDKEDLAGKPFVGPAGQMFNKGLDDAGIGRGEAYVTNAVKHFKFEPRGERRIHAKPNAREMAACRPWLEAEIATVRPKLIVCLGATAAQSLMGPAFRITRDRGRIFTDTPWAPAVIATNHPSAILRVPEADARAAAYEHFVADLKIVREQMHAISRTRADESARRMPTPAGGASLFGGK
jgi:DNA polymerase